jgi:hypothetical protein
VHHAADPVGLRLRGRAVQVEPMKLRLKAPGTERLKLKYDDPLSNFAFTFNLRRCTTELNAGAERVVRRGGAT